MDTRYSDEQLELQRSAASLVADLGPKTVDDLDDVTRRDRLADAARPVGMVRAARSRRRRRPAGLGRRGRDHRPRSWDAPRPTRRILGPVVAADLARHAGLEVEDAATSAVLDRSLLDFAIAPAASPRASRSTAPGSTRGLALVGGDGDGTGAATWSRSSLPDPTPETDLTRAVAPVDLADVAPDGDGAAVGEDAIARSRARWRSTITVADLLGTMEGVLDTTAEYAKERQQYGVPIGSFQAVQHLLAEARVLVEGSISVAQYAAWAVDALPSADALGRGRRSPRRTARRAARTVCETAIQVHGGIGNTWECFVHVYLRRALLSSALLGDEGHHLRALAQRRLGVGTERQWTSMTRPRKRRSGRASAPGWSTTTRACRRRRPTTSTGRKQAEWHCALFDGGFFALTWPKRIRRPGAAAGLRGHRRRGARRRGRAAEAGPRLPDPGDHPPRQRRDLRPVPACA